MNDSCDWMFSYKLGPIGLYILLSSVELIPLNVFFQLTLSDVILNFILELLTLLSGVTIVRMKGAILGCVNIGTLPHRIRSSKIRLVCDCIQNLFFVVC